VWDKLKKREVCMVRVLYFLLALNITVFGYVTVTSPNGGEVITRGGVHEITWDDDHFGGC
jgi:hypothetical protein